MHISVHFISALVIISLVVDISITQYCSSTGHDDTGLACHSDQHDDRQTSEAEDSSELEESLRMVLAELKSPIKVRAILKTGNFDILTSPLTALSALIDIGVIAETDNVTRKDPAIYQEWLKIFEAVINPLVFFTDKETVAERVLEIRQKKPTMAVVIEKYSTWAFSKILAQYREVFEDENYPKCHPNTIYPEYACVTHAKFEFMQVVSHWNPYKTEAAAWVDVGVYRLAVETSDFREFEIRPPMDAFNPSKITVNQIREPEYYEDNHRFIMMYSPSLISGSFWLGNMDVFQKFTKDYMKHVQLMLDEGLANCEEQVLGSMYLPETVFKPTVDIEIFNAADHPTYDMWFCLAHIVRERGLLEDENTGYDDTDLACHSDQCDDRQTSEAEDSSELEESLRMVLAELKSPVQVTAILKSGSFDNVTSPLTALSALIDIGVIPQTDIVTRKDPAIYQEWLRIFGAYTNPLVFFTEKESIAKKVLEIRQSKPTMAVVIEKYSTWAFGNILPQYHEVFEGEYYPKHHPNTIYPEYACVTHAKFEFMRVVSHWNPYKTEAAAWVDVGIFRFAVEASDLREFEIRPPIDAFHPNKITVNKLREPEYYEDNHRFIMKYSPSIIGGGFWLGNMDVLQKFTKDYMKHVQLLLDEGLANCEEQVLASMFLPETLFKPAVDIEIFNASDYPTYDMWFCLAHIIRERSLL